MENDDFLTPAERAESGFKAFIKTMPDDIRESIETEAWENAFSAEVYDEYEDDAERWVVALATAKMLIDQRGL